MPADDSYLRQVHLHVEADGREDVVQLVDYLDKLVHLDYFG